MPIGQFNIARALYPLDDPRMAGFKDNIQRINAIAERTPGFVWRLLDEEGPDAPKFPGDPRMTFTLSVWADPASLARFTWHTLHKRFRMRTAEWFEPMDSRYLVMWPIAEGHRPDGDEALARLAELDRTGPSDRVFGTEALLRKEPV
jgi:hypothetical protein